MTCNYSLAPSEDAACPRSFNDSICELLDHSTWNLVALFRMFEDFQLRHLDQEYVTNSVQEFLVIN